ncbi:MAG TPA: hypothetical protein VFN11_07160 [Ktedonobacterales bacterium]|nr:hypothetical protein [Ktedonobacterales bacterium]
MTLYGWTLCRSCSANVYWLKNDKTGKIAPIGAMATEAGNIEIDVGKQTYRVVGKQPGRHTNHFVTCPSRDIWKRHGGSGMRGPRERENQRENR